MYFYKIISLFTQHKYNITFVFKVMYETQNSHYTLHIHAVTFNVLDFAACRTPRTALTSDPLTWSRRKLNFDMRFFQWSSSARGPISSASRRICSLSANTWTRWLRENFYKENFHFFSMNHDILPMTQWNTTSHNYYNRGQTRLFVRYFCKFLFQLTITITFWLLYSWTMPKAGTYKITPEIRIPYWITKRYTSECYIT